MRPIRTYNRAARTTILAAVTTFALIGMGARQKTAPAAPTASQRAALGVTLGVGSRDGVQITAVTPNSPAAKSGLYRGDIIQKIDDWLVSRPEDVIRAIDQCKPQQRIRVYVDRRGLHGSLWVILGTRQEVELARQQQSAPALRPVAPTFTAPPQPYNFYDNMTPADIDDQRGYGG